MTEKKSLHVACWNINGFTHKGYNKFSDPRFLNEIQNKDIFCLLETHCSLEESLNLPFFKSVHLIRPKSARTNKRSGGISVYVKNNIRKGITFLTRKYNDYIWLQLTREFFNLEKDIYLCFIYDPPGNSTYTHSLEENILDILEEDITKYAVDGDIILMGDINARTGDQETDFYSK